MISRVARQFLYTAALVATLGGFACETPAFAQAYGYGGGPYGGPPPPTGGYPGYGPPPGYGRDYDDRGAALWRTVRPARGRALRLAAGDRWPTRRAWAAPRRTAGFRRAEHRRHRRRPDGPRTPLRHRSLSGRGAVRPTAAAYGRPARQVWGREAARGSASAARGPRREAARPRRTLRDLSGLAHRALRSGRAGACRQNPFHRRRAPRRRAAAGEAQARPPPAQEASAAPAHPSAAPGRKEPPPPRPRASSNRRGRPAAVEAGPSPASGQGEGFSRGPAACRRWRRAGSRRRAAVSPRRARDRASRSRFYRCACRDSPGSSPSSCSRTSWLAILVEVSKRNA